MSYSQFERRHPSKSKEDFAYVLDIFNSRSNLPYKRGNDRVTQLIGEKFFTPLEALAKEGINIKVLEKVYIGLGHRDKISTVLSRISFKDLTPFAKAELEESVKKIIIENEQRWVNLFNKCGPLTSKLHSLELFQGIGKKTMWEIIQERDRKQFTSFRDIHERVGVEVVKVIAKRVIQELEGGEKYNILIDTQ